MLDIPSNAVKTVQSRNDGVWVHRPRRSKRWRHIGTRRVRVMKKLDQSKVEWIIAQKRKEKTNKEIADAMGVSTRWVKKLWARYKSEGANRAPCATSIFPDGKQAPPKKGIEYPLPLGRPRSCPPGRRTHSLVLSHGSGIALGAASMERIIESETGVHIPHNAIHGILKDNDMATTHPKKSGRRKWIRYERDHSNSMWHTDFMQLDDGRWFLGYQDDASRFITGWPPKPTR